MASLVFGFLLMSASNSTLSSLLVETLSLPESGGLIVIGSLLISGAVFLRLRRSARRKSD